MTSAYANPDALVSVDELAKRRTSEDVRVVEVDVDTARYAKGHVPGAVGWDWTEDLNHPVRRDILDREGFEQLAREAGISNDTTVLLYGDNHNWFAAFALWLFQYYGHDDVALVDGGRDAIARAGVDLVTETPDHAEGDFEVTEVRDELRATRDEVLDAVEADHANFIDVRSPEEFTGEVIAPPDLNETAQRGGHIPGATNVPWSTAVNEDGTFKPRDELEEIDADVVDDDGTIVYCRIGERSSHSWFVIRHLLGDDDATNYDGSMPDEEHAEEQAGQSQERDAWDSRLGYVLAMVGSAVGLGNIVRFPFVTSEEGGAVFVLLYLVSVFLIGIPMLMAELMLGRRAKRNVVDTFDLLGGQRWKVLGVLLIGFNVFVMSWFSVIGGWTLIYVVEGVLEGVGPAFWADPTGFFFAETEGPGALVYHAIFIAITTAVVAFGISDGIEPAVKVLLPVLGVMLVGLSIYGLTLDGAATGIEFYLQPDLSAIDANTFTAAAGQALFSMSVGFGALITYASYMGEDSSLSEDGVAVGVSDTLVALTAGFLIFPILGAFSLLGTPAVQEGGLGVAFLALPSAFQTLGGQLGATVGLAFFFLLFVAALSSSISLMEVGTAWITERDVPRWKAAVLLGLVMYGVGIPMALSQDTLNFAGGTLTDLFLITATFAMAIFVGFLYEKRLGESVVEELDRGSDSFKLGRISYVMIRYALPVVLVILFAVALPDFLDEVRAITGWSV